MSRLTLHDKTPLGVGRQRVVYLHPLRPDLVIKLPLAQVLEDQRDRQRSRFHRRYLFRHLVDTYSEFRAHLILYARNNELPFRVARFHGFVETDLGLGEICELKTGADGRPAPSLRDILAKGGYTAAHEAAVLRFLDWLMPSDLTLKELHPGNLVYANIGGNRQEFVLIDGVGEKGQLALKSRFRLLNKWHKRKHIRILMDKIRMENVGVPADGKVAA